MGYSVRNKIKTALIAAAVALVLLLLSVCVGAQTTDAGEITVKE